MDFMDIIHPKWWNGHNGYCSEKALHNEGLQWDSWGSQRDSQRDSQRGPQLSSCSHSLWMIHTGCPIATANGIVSRRVLAYLFKELYSINLMFNENGLWSFQCFLCLHWLFKSIVFFLSPLLSLPFSPPIYLPLIQRPFSLPIFNSSLFPFHAFDLINNSIRECSMVNWDL